MVVGVLLGYFVPEISAFLNKFEYARVSIPMAILILGYDISNDAEGGFASVKM